MPVQAAVKIRTSVCSQKLSLHLDTLSVGPHSRAQGLDLLRTSIFCLYRLYMVYYLAIAVSEQSLAIDLPLNR